MTFKNGDNVYVCNVKLVFLKCEKVGTFHCRVSYRRPRLNGWLKMFYWLYCSHHNNRIACSNLLTNRLMKKSKIKIRLL